MIGVTRDGNYEPSFVEKRSGYYRINTGDDSFLPRPATSTFEIKYKVWNLPKSYEDYDEIYWNVTGDQWAFPIESVSAQIELPHGVDIIQQASYIGYAGSKESAIYEGNGQYTGHYLSPGEQLTIAVGFTPGIISTKKYISQADILQNIIPFFLYFICLGFLIWAWHKKGRDPAERAIMPQYEPPTELTAAQATCLYNKRKIIKINPVSVSLIQMITNGFLKMTSQKEQKALPPYTVYILEKTENLPSNMEEKCVRAKKIKLDGQYHAHVASLSRHLKSKIEDSMKPFYTENRPWVLLPTILSLLILLYVWFPSFMDFFGLTILGPCAYRLYTQCTISSISALYRMGWLFSKF